MQHAIDLVMEHLMLRSSMNYLQTRHIVENNLQRYFKPPHKPPLSPTIDKKRFGTRSQWIKEIHIPTLLLVGDNAISEIQLSSIMLEKSIQGAQKCEIAQSKYLLNVEKTEQFNRVIVDFLQRI